MMMDIIASFLFVDGCASIRFSSGFQPRDLAPPGRQKINLRDRELIHWEREEKKFPLFIF